MKNKIKALKFRRRREGKTNYSKRLLLLKSNKPRIIIRKSLKTLTAQIGKYDEKGDQIICSVNSATLKKHGWKYNTANISAAYLTGLLIAKKAKEKGIKKAILDSGITRSVKGNKIYSLLKGVRDGGLDVPIDEKMFPKEETIKGETIKKYAENLKPENKSQFSNYLKNNKNPKEITKIFEETKNKIMSENK